DEPGPRAGTEPRPGAATEPKPRPGTKPLLSAATEPGPGPGTEPGADVWADRTTLRSDRKATIDAPRADQLRNENQP
ncbi:MAG: hypothetical protein ACRDZ8_07260, partial [Acidimicrobiales bacterium]